MREWRRTHPLSEDGRRKDNCRSYANVMLKEGLIQWDPCLQCGSIKSEMHHPDYSNPMLVVWLCRQHHLELHYP